MYSRAHENFNKANGKLRVHLERLLENVMHLRNSSASDVNRLDSLTSQTLEKAVSASGRHVAWILSLS